MKRKATIYSPARRCLDRHNVKYDRHRALRIDQEDYDNFDAIYVMGSHNLRNIMRIVDDIDNKIKILDDDEINDPFCRFI